MLKAIQHGKYRNKKGSMVLTYVVTGPAVEVEEYVVIQSAQTNKTPEQWPRVNNNPLFYVNLANELAQGRAPKATIDLVKSFDGTRYFQDDTREETAKWARVSEKMEDELAKNMARIQLGLDKVATPVARPMTAPAIAPPKGAGIEEEILEHIADGEHAETVPTGAGTETLAG